MEQDTTAIALVLALATAVVGLLQYARNLIQSFGDSKEKYIEENLKLKEQILILEDSVKDLRRKCKFIKTRNTLLTEQLKTANIIIKRQNIQNRDLLRRLQAHERKSITKEFKTPYISQSDEDDKLP